MSRERQRADVGEMLDAAYAAVPDAGCRGLCLMGCGSVAMTALEQRRIADRHGKVLPLVAAPAMEPFTVQPGGQMPGRCAALTRAGQCQVYADRPMVCRLYGAAEGLRCPYGCEPADGLMSESAGWRALARVRELDRRAGATDLLAEDRQP